MPDENNRIIGFEIKGMCNLIMRSLEQLFHAHGPDGLSGMQSRMLGFILERVKKQDVFQRDVEKEFNIRRSTASVMLQVLEQKGLLSREAVKEDARLKRIVPTQKAEQMNQQIRSEIDAFHEKMEQGISREEKETFLCVMDKMKKNLEQE